MSMQSKKGVNPGRRRFLSLAAGVPGVAAGLSLAMRIGDVAAQNKMSKEAAKYQEQPKDGQRCDGCQLYIPADGDGPGACKVVEGDIAPDAWCTLFAPKG
jgi:hypothetical protein